MPGGKFSSFSDFVNNTNKVSIGPSNRMEVDPSRYDGTFVIPDINPYGVLNKNRANNQGLGMELATGALNLIPNIALSVAEQAGYIFDLEDWSNAIANNSADYGNALTRLAEKHKNPFGEIYRKNPDEAFDITDSGFWTSGLFSTLESAGAFALTGYGVGSIFGKASMALSNSLRATGALKYGLQGAAQLATSATLAYTEGAMTGHQVYTNSLEDIINTNYKKYIDQGLSHEEALMNIDSQMGEFKQIAGKGASKAVRENLLYNTLLNIPEVTPLFRSMGASRALHNEVKILRGESLDAAKQRLGTFLDEQITTGKLARNRDLKDLVLTTGSEALEEGVNVYAEEQGMNVSREYLGKDIKTLADIMADDHTYAAAFWGAVGGGMQNVVMNSMPKWVTQPDGTKERTTIGKYNREQLSKTYEEQIGDLTDRFTEFIEARNNLQKASENNDDKLYNESINKIFNYATYNNIVKGTEEQLLEQYQDISRLSPEEALTQGFKENYREEAIKKIQDIEKYTKEWNKISDLYSSQDLDLAGYPETIFQQYINVENNKQIIQEQLKNINELQAKINQSYALRGTDLTVATLNDRFSSIEAVEGDIINNEVERENLEKINTFPRKKKKELQAKYNLKYGSLQQAKVAIDEQSRILNEKLEDLENSFEIDKAQFLLLKDPLGKLTEEEKDKLFYDTVIANSHDINNLAESKKNLVENRAILTTQEKELQELRSKEGKQKYRELVNQKAEVRDQDTKSENDVIEKDQKTKEREEEKNNINTKIRNNVELTEEEEKTKEYNQNQDKTTKDNEDEEGDHQGDDTKNIQTQLTNVNNVISNNDGDTNVVKDLVTNHVISEDEKLIHGYDKIAYASTREFTEDPTTGEIKGTSIILNPKTNPVLLTDKFQVGTKIKVRRLTAEEFALLEPYTAPKDYKYVNELGEERLIAPEGQIVQFSDLQHPFIYPIGVFDENGVLQAKLHDVTYIRPERVVESSLEGDLKALQELRSNIGDKFLETTITSITNGKLNSRKNEFNRVSDLSNSKIRFAIAKSTVSIHETKTGDAIETLNKSFYRGQVYMLVKTKSNNTVAIPVKITQVSENPEVKKELLATLNKFLSGELSRNQLQEVFSKYLHSTNLTDKIERTIVNRKEVENIIREDTDRYYINYDNKNVNGIEFGKSGGRKLFLSKESPNKEHLLSQFSNILDNLYININFNNIKDNDFVKQYTSINLPIYDLPDGTYTVFDNPVFSFDATNLVESKTKAEVKEETVQEKPQVNTNDIDAKKADVERRRQEELDNLFSKTQASTDKQLNTPVQKLSKEEVSKNIETAKQQNKDLIEELENPEFLNDEKRNDEWDKKADELSDKLPQGVSFRITDGKVDFFDSQSYREKGFGKNIVQVSVGNLHNKTEKFEVGDNLQVQDGSRAMPAIVTKVNEHGKILEAKQDDGKIIISKGNIITLAPINNRLKINAKYDAELAALESQELQDSDFENTEVVVEEVPTTQVLLPGIDQYIDIRLDDESDEDYSPNTVKDNIKPGVAELFNENPELASIGSIELYSQYLNSVTNEPIVYKGFRNKSGKVHNTPNHSYYSNNRDIVEKWYSTNKEIKSYIIPKVKTISFKVQGNTPFSQIRKQEEDFINSNRNALIKLNTNDIGGKQTQFVLDRNIKPIEVGSKQDIEGFKEFVNNKSPNTENNLSLQIKVDNLLNQGKITKYCR